MSDDEDEGYELVMPFVACRSQGGDFDDDSFVAGYQAGKIDMALTIIVAAGGDEHCCTVDSRLARQLDLIALKHNFLVKIEETGTDGWSYATFRRTT